jgi:hypothetical protein
VPYCGNGFPTYKAWGYILDVLVHVEDEVWNRPDTFALTRLEATRGCKDLQACGTRTFWANSALALAKRSNQRTVLDVHVFGRIRQGWPTISLMHVFRVGALRNALVIAVFAVASKALKPNRYSCPSQIDDRIFMAVRQHPFYIVCTCCKELKKNIFSSVRHFIDIGILKRKSSGGHQTKRRKEEKT